MDYQANKQSTVCGFKEAESSIYSLHIGKTGYRWLLSTRDNCADEIYVEIPHVPGFGGADIEFTLIDLTSLVIKGPRHSNCDAFFLDTGIDVRDKCRTFGVIAEKFGKKPRFTDPPLLLNVIHIDTQPQIGAFDRIGVLAQQLSDIRKKEFVFYIETNGGAHCGRTK